MVFFDAVVVCFVLGFFVVFVCYVTKMLKRNKKKIEKKKKKKIDSVTAKKLSKG